MSATHYKVGGLRFWNEREILLRERLARVIVETVKRELRTVNQGWAFERVDCPVIVPTSRINPSYTEDDVFILEAMIDGSPAALRAETTDGSYLMAMDILKNTRTNPPLCVWQIGQSFRRELSDGANAANLRFNAFYQLEFQFVYSADTHFDYATLLKEKLEVLIKQLLVKPTRLVPSDRLPSYSLETTDLEVLWHPPTKDKPEWKEVCSMSRRTDFPKDHGFKKELKVFEVAFGMDRLVAIHEGEL